MTIDLTAQIHQYLTTAPSSLFAQQEVTMHDHWQGDTHLLWRVEAGNQLAVVKLFLDAGQARSRRQFDGHQIFAPRGLAPQPLWWDRYPHGLSRQLIVYRWCDGETVAPDDPSTLRAWAEAIATLHTTSPDEVRRFSPHPLNLDFYWRIEEGSITQIEKWLTPSGLALTTLFHQIALATEKFVRASLPLWASAAPTPIHGDLTRDHTLLERGSVTLLDWEMFGLGDPAQDVARLLQHEAQTLSPDSVKTWLDHYGQVADQPGLAARIAIYQRLLEVHNVVYLLVGLEQNTTGQLDQTLSDALPFIENTLATALEHAMNALDLSMVANLDQIAADFIIWLRRAAPAAR